MKTFSLSFKLLVLLLCSFLTVSCGNDDEEELRTLENQLEYENTIYELTVGLTVDLGPVPLSTTETHYGRIFVVSDYSASGGEKVNLVLYPFSLGTSDFKTGRFEYANFAGLTPAQRETTYGKKNFFVNSSLYVDLNKDEELEDSEEIKITGGTVNISGTAPNYILDCDLELENGKRVRAQYEGDFIDITDDLDDEDIKADLKIAPGTVPSGPRVPKKLKID